MASGIAPGCTRLTIDLPNDLHERLKADAARPPSIPTSEYVRRLVAYHLNYTLPPYGKRKQQRLTVSGQPYAKSGPKPKTVPEA